MPKLKDLATIRSGFKVLESDYRESGLRVLTAGDIKDTFSIIITENRFLEASESRMNHLLEQGDILMVSVGSKIGIVFMKKLIAKKKGRPINPNLLPTVSVSIRLTESLIEQLDKISIKEGRSRTKQIEIIVKNFVESYNK